MGAHRYEAVHAVKRFLRLTQEPVIMDFHRFAINSNLPKLSSDFLLALMGKTRQRVMRTLFGTFRSTQCETEFPASQIKSVQTFMRWNKRLWTMFTFNPTHKGLKPYFVLIWLVWHERTDFSMYTFML